MTRTPDEIDSELRIVSAVRELYGGSMKLTDRLLDERNDVQRPGENPDQGR